MKIRFEVAARKSWGWPYFLERAKKHGQYRIQKNKTTEMHVVEFDNLDACLEVWQAIQSWKGVWVYADDKPIAVSDFKIRMWKYSRREINASLMLREILEKAAQKKAQSE